MVPAILARSDQPHLRDARVSVAGTLAQARAVLAERHIDLVLLDMRLPDGSGLPLAAELRDQKGPAIAVIALTGAPAEHGDDALAAGCVAVLGKPYRLAELRDLVAAHLPDGQPGPGPAAEPAAAAGEPSAAAQEPAAAHQAGTEQEPAPAHQAGTEQAPAVPHQGRPAIAVDFRRLFAALPSAYLVLDPELRIVAVSDAYAMATRAAAADLVGRDIWEALPQDPGSPRPGALPGLRESLDQVRRNRAPDIMEVQKC